MSLSDGRRKGMCQDWISSMVALWPAFSEPTVVATVQRQPPIARQITRQR